MMRGPRSRAGLTAYPARDPYQLAWDVDVAAAGLTGLHPKRCSNA
jgi:hypothetical protein